MSSFRWSNVPLPEGHLVALTAGVTLQVLLPLKLLERSWLNDALGWPLLALGVLVVAWAVVELKDMDIAKPTSVVTSGPYAFSRHPMYVAWTTIYLAVASLLNSWWLLILLPALLVLTHFLVVRREERWLEDQLRPRVSRLSSPRAAVPVAGGRRLPSPDDSNQGPQRLTLRTSRTRMVTALWRPSERRAT